MSDYVQQEMSVNPNGRYGPTSFADATSFELNYCPSILPPERYLPPRENHNQRSMRPKAPKKKRGKR